MPNSAAIYFDIKGCATCRKIAIWFESKQPTNLEILDARLHPRGGLTRVTYKYPSSENEIDGVRAIGRALGHLSMGWRGIGLLTRLPVLWWLVQVCLDKIWVKPHRVEKGEQ